MKRFLLGVFLTFCIFVIYFNRSPVGITNWSDSDIVAPSWGTVYEIQESDTHYKIIIFLSPLDIHVQYCPVNGILCSQKYDRTGKFHLAYRLGKSSLNEKMIHEFVCEHGTVVVTQVAGYLTRRIKKWIDSDYGAVSVSSGESLGIIMLGSRVDIDIPKPCLIEISIGDKLHGGRQKIGEFI